MAWNITLTGKLDTVTIDGGGEGTFTCSGADAETQNVTIAGMVQHVFSGNDQIHTRLTMTSQGGVTEVDPWISVTGDDLTMTTVRAAGVLGQAIDFINITSERSLFANWWVETDRHGVVLTGAIRNTFNGFHIECGSQADDTWDGFNVSTSDFNLFNTIEVIGDGGANDPRCGVNITDAASNDNYVGVVHAPDSQTSPICDSGTDSITPQLVGHHVTRITGATTLDTTHDNVFADTDAAAFTVSLPAGIQDTYYRIVNTGTDALTISPNGAELLLGTNSDFVLAHAESLILMYDATEGWF